MRLFLATISLICCAACSSQVVTIGAAAGADGGTVLPDGGVIGSAWVPVTSNLAGMASECGDMSFVSVNPHQDMIIAGIARDGLYAASDGGLSFAPLGKGTGSDTIFNRTSSIVYDPDHPQTFWESGTYNFNAVYRTDDNGATFKALGDATHSDLVSIDFTDPARQTLLAGTHENTPRLWLSTNGGTSWTDIFGNLPVNIGYASAPHVIDSHTFLLGTYSAGSSGIFRSGNGGATWTQVFTSGVRNRPLAASDGKLYWPVDGDGGLAVSNDEGVTWSKVGPANTVSTIQGGPSLLELPDGRFAALGSSNNVVVSSDHGQSWKAVSSNFPATKSAIVGLAYSPVRKAFLIWHFGCDFSNDTVANDAILATPFDYQTQ